MTQETRMMKSNINQGDEKNLYCLQAPLLDCDVNKTQETILTNSNEEVIAANRGDALLHIYISTSH